MIVTLIGYRGCGKSSVAPLLAAKLGCECVDSDDVIEERAVKNIAQIFADDGEAAFRKLETDVLQDLLAEPPKVIAAGGGAILDDFNRTRMQQAGPVVWLNADAEILAQRIAGDAASVARRPSLTGQSVLAEVASVLTSRLSLYKAAATMIVSANKSTPEELAGQIFDQLSAPSSEATS